jgi:hypothetical protein
MFVETKRMRGRVELYPLVLAKVKYKKVVVFKHTQRELNPITITI